MDKQLDGKVVNARRVLCSAGKGELTVDECLACAAKGKPPCGMDYGLVRTLVQKQLRPKIHVTDLTGCLKRAYLSKTQPVPEYPHEKLLLIMGTAAHGFLEGDDEVLDTEVVVDHDGIVGRVDVIYKTGRIVDYKTTRWLKIDNLPYGSHAAQLNIYRYLRKKSGHQVDGLAVQYIDMSGPSKCRACKVPVRKINGQLTCPKCGNPPKGAHLGAVLVEIPVWSDEDIENYVTTRRDVLQEALDTGLVPVGEPSFLCSYCPFFDTCEEGIRSFGARR